MSGIELEVSRSGKEGVEGGVKLGRKQHKRFESFSKMSTVRGFTQTSAYLLFFVNAFS